MTPSAEKEKIILLIDDKPDEVRWDDSTDDLQQIIQNICNEAGKSGPFSFKCETAVNKDAALSLLDNLLFRDSTAVGCILLDVHFENEKDTGAQSADSGQDIAKTLEEQYSQIPIIVLTHLHDEGTKRGMGFRRNTYYFQDKNEISKDRKRLTKILFALATDKYNQLWSIEYHHKNHLSEFTLRHQVHAPKGVSIPVTNSFGSDMATLLSSPLGEPCDVSDVSKFKSSINSNIRTSTKWQTWGLLDRVNCSSGQVRLQVGRITNSGNNKKKQQDLTENDHHLRLLSEQIAALESRVKTLETQQKDASPQR